MISDDRPLYPVGKLDLAALGHRPIACSSSHREAAQREQPQRQSRCM